MTIENPYQIQDFKDDKLSILDIKATDQTGAIYGIEMELSICSSLIQRIVFYGCEIDSGELESGEDDSLSKPLFPICLLDGVLWRDSQKVHHPLGFTDLESGRKLTNDFGNSHDWLGRYHPQGQDLATASPLDRWLYWLLHAHE